MPDKFVSEPDENSGPAILGREPILFPEQRKKLSDKTKSTVNDLRDKVGGN